MVSEQRLTTSGDYCVDSSLLNPPYFPSLPPPFPCCQYKHRSTSLWLVVVPVAAGSHGSLAGHIPAAPYWPLPSPTTTRSLLAVA